MAGGVERERAQGQARVSVDPEETLTGLVGEVRRAFRSAGQGLARVADFLPIFIYFSVYWRRKERARSILRRVAGYYFTLSFLFLVLEVFLKIFGIPLAEFLRAQSYQGYLVYANLVYVALMVFFGYVLVWHNLHEGKLREGEDTLGEHLWRLLNAAPETHLLTEPSKVLSLAFHAFKRFGVTRASVWTAHGDVLRTKSGSWYPEAQASDLLLELPRDSVAGAVYGDGIARYVPRVFFPFNMPAMRWASRRFRHAIEFLTEFPGESGGVPKVSGKKMSVNSVYFPNEDVPSSMFSFLVVPIKDPSQQRTHGVLVVEFKSTDPLGTC